jgi:hypothetical protein
MWERSADAGSYDDAGQDDRLADAAVVSVVPTGVPAGVPAIRPVGVSRSGGKVALPRKRRQYRETPEVAKAVGRLIRALGNRIGTEDPPDLEHLVSLEAELREAWRVAIEGLRCSEFTDKEIGAVLGTSRQPVEQRWPWTGARIVL